VTRQQASVTFPVSTMTPIELSSLASSNARLSSFTVSGRKASHPVNPEGKRADAIKD
jgi:hypothetical protein